MRRTIVVPVAIAVEEPRPTTTPTADVVVESSVALETVWAAERTRLAFANFLSRSARTPNNARELPGKIEKTRRSLFSLVATNGDRIHDHSSIEHENPRQA